jgi:hypothetical protein
MAKVRKKVVDKRPHVNTKMVKKKKKGGRPTKFKLEYIQMGRDVCQYLGATDIVLARIFKTTEQGIHNWRKAHPKFAAALKQGKDTYDINMVEDALLRRAMGYEYKEIETTIKKVPGTGKKKGKSVGRIIEKKIRRKQMAPDVQACIFWLCNRNRDRWNNKHHTADGNDGITNNNTFIKIDELNLSLNEKKIMLAQIRKEQEQRQNVLPGNTK